MKNIILSNLLFFTHTIFSQTIQNDWLVNPVKQKADIIINDKNIVLNNGLVKRVFRIDPNVACFDYTNLTNGQQLIRAIKPEAKVVIDGKLYNIGGLKGQSEMAYLQPDWLDKMVKGNEDFVYKSYKVTDIQPFINWKPSTWAMNKKHATGKVLTFEFISPLEKQKGISIKVNYELYDGIPLIVKWLSIENNSQANIKLNRVVNEVLGLVEEESAVVGRPEEMKKQHGIYFETNYAFNNAMRYDISDQTTHWKTDSTYTSQVNYNFQTPALLEIYPENASGVEVQVGETYKSVRTHELLMDSYDRNRRGLMLKRMYSKIAPWTTENPIFMHLVSKTDDQVITAIDQCEATGYEAVILSFGSHLNMEDESAENITRWKNLADYAHKKNILLGGYSLFSSRKINDQTDVIDAKTGKPGGAGEALKGELKQLNKNMT